jgi:hypothetical protein
MALSHRMPCVLQVFAVQVSPEFSFQPGVSGDPSPNPAKASLFTGSQRQIVIVPQEDPEQMAAASGSLKDSHNILRSPSPFLLRSVEEGKPQS